jgi:peptidoglycan/LPS O-acetylase OafA/YrhL
MTERNTALDGVRGVAILLVMFCHMNILEHTGGVVPRTISSVLAAGWCGVDLFFVLSGFLITRILLASKNEHAYFRNFYARRILRIVPVYYFVLALVFIILPLTPFQTFQVSAAAKQSQWVYWLFVQNYFMAHTKGFGLSLLTVTWSLAIEEQFYLVWPLLVRLASSQSLKRICIGMIVSANVLRGLLALAHANWIASYVLTPTRMDSLAVGALVAIWRIESDRPRLRRLFVPLMAATFVLSVVEFQTYGAANVFGYTILAFAFAGLLELALDPSSRWSRLLDNRALRFFGKYSYALYLLHPAILRAVAGSMRWYGHPQPFGGPETLFTQFVFICYAIAGSVAAAMISWNLLEKPFLRLKDRFAASIPFAQRQAPLGALPRMES